MALALIASAPALAQADEASLGHYVEARILDAAGQNARAAAAYGLALTGAPQEERVAIRAYRQAIEAGNRALAVRAAQSLDVQKKLPGDGLVLLFVDAAGRGDWRSAARLADRIEENSNFDFLSPILRAWVRHATREGDPLELLAGSARESLTNAYAREQRVYLLLAAKRADEGVDAARAAAAADSRSVWLRLAAASRLAELGRKDAAISLLGGDVGAISKARSMVEAGQPLPGGVNTAQEGIGILLARIAGDLVRDNVTGSALTLARLASFIAPAHPQVGLTLAQSLSGSGQPDMAIEALGPLGDAPLFGSAVRELRFAALRRSKGAADALELAERDARRTDADLQDYARLGDAFSAVTRHGDAAVAYERAIALAGNDAQWNLWLLYGGALDAAGDWAKAKPALQKAVALAPEQPAALNHLGYAMLERKDDLAEATRLIAKASALRPDDPAITDSLGWAFYLRGQTAESIAILEKAVASDPSEPALGEHLGDAYWAAGRRIDARYAWQAALIQAEGEDQIKRITIKLADGLP